MSLHAGAFRQTLKPNFPLSPPAPLCLWMVLWGNCQHLVVVSSLLAGTPVGCLLGCGCILSRLPGQVLPSVTEAQAALALPFFMLFQCCRGRKGSTHPKEKVGLAIFTCDWQSDSSAGWGQVGTVMGVAKNRTWLSNEQFHFFVHAWMCRVEQWCSGKQLPRSFLLPQILPGRKISLRVASTFHWSNGRRDH